MCCPKYVAFFLTFALLTACNPSPKLKAIAADKEIQREVCDLFPGIPIQKGDTLITKERLDYYDTIRDAYCAA